MTEAISERIDALKSKLQARKTRPGFEKNVVEIQKEIDRLQAILERNGQ